MKPLFISIVIPVYNEEAAIRQTINEIRKAFRKSTLKYEIVVVNDGSKDNSLSIIREIKDLVVVNHLINKGYGASLKAGIHHAKGDLIAITDADGTYQNELIPKMAELAESYEMVVAARTAFQSRYPFSKKVAKVLLNTIIFLLTKTQIPDINSGLRVFRRETAIKHLHLLPDKFSFTTTITICYISENRTMKYIDSVYYDRKGDSKIVPFDFVRFVIKIITTVNYFMPMRIFSPVGISLGILGGISFILDLFVFDNITDKTLLLVLVSISIILMGFLADLVVKRTTPVT
ncbi:glycosyltransferase family 2 protein [Candidatus Nomurabacteria bacterium]|nr:glycosyltransferase family 2 protein [Candidatus Nomurabacteria bacterium]